MTVTVNGPNNVTVNFPDGTDHDTIDTVMRHATGMDGKSDQAATPKADAGSSDYSMGDVGMAALRGIPIAGGIVERMSSPESQAQYKQFDTAHPYISTGAKLAGGVAALGPLGMTGLGARALGMGGETLAGMALRSGVSGAGIGGADALARGDDIKSAAETGAALGALGPVAGRAVGSAVRGATGVVDALRPINRGIGNFERVAGVDVPIEAGQLAGDVNAQRYVESARKGVLGEGAKNEVGTFDASRTQAVDQARENIRQSLSSGMAPAKPVNIENPYDAAQMVQGGVQREATAAKAAAQAKYDQFGQMEGSVKADAFEGIGNKIKSDLTNSQSPVIVSDKTTPAASAMLDHLDTNLGRLKIQNKADPLGAPKSTTETQTILKGPGYHIADDVSVPPNITAISLEGLDRSRRELLSLARGAAPGSEDQRAARRIIQTFDGHLQDAVQSHLYSGDARAFETLKDARRMWSNYAQTFKSQGPGDMAGKVVEKMIGRADQPASFKDISNWLYGASGMGGSSTSVAVYKKLLGIFGAGSPELQALRQGLFSRLTEATEGKIQFGPQKVSQRIFEFLNGEGKQLSQTAFTPQERALIDQYGQLMKRLTPAPGVVNYSNTGHQMASMLRWTTNALATIGGLHVGGPVGMAAGFASNKLATGAIDRVHARAVARHLYDPASVPQPAGPGRLERGAALASRLPIGAINQQRNP